MNSGLLSQRTNPAGKLTAIDLFAGCGGCTVGLKRAGFNVLAAVEIDEVAKRVYELNHPTVQFWHCDIANVTGLQLFERLALRQGGLDLLAGCPPCQGFSSVRTLNGKRNVEDSRNELIFHFERLVRELLPKAVMLENVPGLSKDWRLNRFASSLRELGYSTESAVLNAADYGVPQRRRRFILLASRYGSVPWAQPVRVRRTVRDAIGELKRAGKSGDSVHDIAEQRTPAIKALIRLIPKDGGSRTDLPDEYQLECHKRCNGFKDIYGRMAWDNVAPTLTTGCFNPSRGRFLHPVEHRAITMREAALLQSFPSRYRFPAELGKTRLAMLIGNALPPEFVARHARQIRRLLVSIQSRPQPAPVDNLPSESWLDEAQGNSRLGQVADSMPGRSGFDVLPEPEKAPVA